MNEREYLRLRRQLDEDYNRKVEALAMVWSMASGGAPLPEVDATPDKGGRIAFSKEILAVLQQLPQMFTTKDVEDELRHDRTQFSPQMDRSTVSHTLKRAAQDGQLEIVEVGRGKRPTVYLQKEFEDRCSPSQLSLIKSLTISARSPVSAMKQVYLESCGVNCANDLSREQARALITKLRGMQRQATGGESHNQPERTDSQSLSEEVVGSVGPRMEIAYRDDDLSNL